MSGMATNIKAAEGGANTYAIDPCSSMFAADFVYTRTSIMPMKWDCQPCLAEVVEAGSLSPVAGSLCSKQSLENIS